MNLYYKFAPDVVGRSGLDFCRAANRVFGGMTTNETQAWCQKHAAVEFIQHTRWLSVRLYTNLSAGLELDAPQTRSVLDQALREDGFYLTSRGGVDTIALWDHNVALTVGTSTAVFIACLIAWLLKFREHF